MGPAFGRGRMQIERVYRIKTPEFIPKRTGKKCIKSPVKD
jgi:hypothetical protein